MACSTLKEKQQSAISKLTYIMSLKKYVHQLETFPEKFVVNFDDVIMFLGNSVFGYSEVFPLKSFYTL